MFKEDFMGSATIGDSNHNNYRNCYKSYQEILKENYDYLKHERSDSNKMKKSVEYLLNCFKSKRFREASLYIHEKVNNLIIRLNSTKTSKKRTRLSVYSGERMAVYTVLLGSRDRLMEPVVIDGNCDYFVITDQDIDSESVWKKIDVYFPDECYDAVLKSRYYKILYYLFLGEYRYSLYLDANVVLYGKPTELVSSINPASGIAFHNHPYRNSVYEEILARKIIEPSDAMILNLQKRMYKSQRYRSGEGMFECNVILRENTESCREIMDLWWEEFRKYPKRDQISLPYVLWKNKISIDDIGIIGNDIRLNPYFRVIEHKRHISAQK